MRAALLLLVLTLAPPRGLHARQVPPGGGMVVDTAGLAADTAAPTSGTFTVLTYNVAGLPPGVSKSKPLQNMPRISPLLGGYDLILVQEDFFFHPLLASAAQHQHQSVPQAASRIFTREFLDMLLSFPRLNVDGILGILGSDRITSDGLNRFSRFPFTEHERHTWASCSGLTGAANDCLASKGFTYARHEIAQGVVVDVYNVHADAGRRPRDETARRAQFRQLAAFMALRSEGVAVLVGGDTNLQSPVTADEETLQEFMAATGLRIVARSLGQSDEVDRFFYRGSTTVTLTPTTRAVASEFVDGGGGPLSDHEAIRVEFRWERISPATPPFR